MSYLDEIKDRIIMASSFLKEKIEIINRPYYLNRYTIFINLSIASKDVGWFIFNMNNPQWKKVFIQDLNNAYEIYFNTKEVL